ncbi:hypothetical protein ACQ4LE_000699 [Meloidogyne hapla]|uniref:Uncharacterized protein n=1 Tax=Meloidogyne hapla TaxID=6305 RepID=A0A1I8BJ73_MELHA
MRRPQTQQTSSSIQNKKSLERKVQKTVANFKASESLLPKSFLDRDSKLVPNNVATKTFKQGRTLHNVLCGEDISKDVQKVPTISSTKPRDRIPFYRNVNRSANSTNNSVSLSTTQISSQIKGTTTIGPKRKIEFSKALDSSPFLQNPRFDENGYAIPNTTNSTPKIKITKDIDKESNQLFEDFDFPNKSVLAISPQVYCGRAAASTDGDENFESAFEESFDTEERERREQIDKLEKINKGTNKNKEDEIIDLFDINFEQTNETEDDNLPINLPSIPTGNQTTFIADLDKHVREIKEGLNFVSEKLDSVVGQMDKTLSDPNISVENAMASNKFAHLSISFKSTQTPDSWLNKSNEEIKQNKDEKEESQSVKKKRDFIFDRKYILRHRIDTLKEYTRIQLYLIREEQRNAFDNKESYSNKFKQLMNDFDLEKKKIKMELFENVDKSKLIDHYIQMFKQQEETRKSIARFKAKQELQFMEHRYFEYCPDISSSPVKIAKESNLSPNLHELNIEENSSDGELDDDLDSTLDVFDAVQSSQIPDNLSDSSTPKKSTPKVPLLDFTLLSINEDIRRKNNKPEQFIQGVEENLPAPIIENNNKLTNILNSSSARQCPLEFLADMALTNEENELNEDISVLPLQQIDIQMYENNFQQEQQIDEQKNDSNISTPSEEENNSGGNTSEDITSLPFVSEKVVNSENDGINQEMTETLNNENVQSPRVKNLENIVSAQEQLIAQISHRNDQPEANNIATSLGGVVEVIAENEDSHSDFPLISNRNGTDSILEEIPSPRTTDSIEYQKNQDIVEGSVSNQNKIKSLNSSSRERTSAEIESIPEEIISVNNGQVSANSLSSSNINSKSEQSQNQELNNDLETNVTSRNNHQLNESLNSTLEDVSDGIVSSFKPSEKSLRSILSSMPSSSLATGRDSLSRRRSSASEALVKLRLMNNVPALSKSPPPQKSPPRTTPRSPSERYLTKFPKNDSSRESICNDDILNSRQSIVPVELLEDLPNASQIGMVLDLSHSPIADLSDKKNIKKDEYFGEKKCIKKYVKFLWKNFMKNGEIDGNSLPEWEMFNIEEEFEDGLSDNLKIPENLLRQLCYERWFNLIQNTNNLLSSKQILSNEENLTEYLQKQVIGLFVDSKREFCPNGIKSRAEKTSHLALDVNRLLLAQYVYENLTV